MTLQPLIGNNSKTTTCVQEELRITGSRIDTLNTRFDGIEAQNQALNYRLEDERRLHANERAALEAELMDLDLMDIEVSVYQETTAYDKLLHGEEFRLNITPGANQSSESFSQSSARSRQTSMTKTKISFEIEDDGKVSNQGLGQGGVGSQIEEECWNAICDKQLSTVDTFNAAFKRQWLAQQTGGQRSRFLTARIVSNSTCTHECLHSTKGGAHLVFVSVLFLLSLRIVASIK